MLRLWRWKISKRPRMSISSNSWQRRELRAFVWTRSKVGVTHFDLVIATKGDGWDGCYGQVALWI